MPLGLPQAERTAVFRAVVGILKADPVLKGQVKTLLSWEGKPTDAADLVLGMAPAIRLTPTGGPDGWMSPNTVVGDLYINFEMLTASYLVDDLMNLWRAVVAAIYDPSSTSFTAIQATLRNAGAYPPSPQFTMPAFDAKPESNFCFGTAQMLIKCQTQLGSRGAPA